MMMVAPAAARDPDRPATTGDVAWAPLAIAVDRCKACELCLAACPKGVLALDPATTNALGHHPVRLVDAARCTSCAFCARVCPDSVFTVFVRRGEA